MINPYSTSLARMAARGVIVRRGNKRARVAAARVGGYVARTAARKIWRWYKKRRKVPARARVGERAGRTNGKHKVTFFESNTNKSTRTLYLQNLTDILRTQVNDIRGRQRDVIFLSGVRVCFEIENNDTVNPMYFNFAVISPKGRNIANTVSDIENSFFRSGTTDSRNVDFADTLASIEFHCLPINTDKWHVISHKRYRLNRRSNAISEGSGHYYKNIDRYYKIKRQIRYDESQANTALKCETPILMVWWCDQFNTTAGTAAQANSMVVSQRHLAYFRETRS